MNQIKILMNDGPVLIVDEDEDDWEFVCVAINEIDPEVEVKHAENGLRALDYLRMAKGNADMFPCLVILDINMPLMDGKQTLAEIKKDTELQHLPIVLFSTSDSEQDKIYCKKYGVELVTKPSSLLSIRNEVKKLLEYCSV